MNRLLLLAMVFACSLAAQGQMAPYTPVDDVKDFLIFKDQAFIVGSPILLAGPTISHPTWSPTGRFLLYEQSQDETNVLNIQNSVKEQRSTSPDMSLLVYSLSDGKSASVVRLDEATGEDPEVYWIANTDRALITLRTFRVKADSEPSPLAEKLFLFDAATATLKELNPWDGGDAVTYLRISPSPTQPYALVQATFAHREYSSEGKPVYSSTSQLALVASTGGFGTVRIPDPTPSFDAMWSPDGGHGYLMTRLLQKKEVEAPQSRWYEISLANASTKSVSRPSSFYMGETKGELISVREVNQNSNDGKSTMPLRALWLETTDPDSQNRLLLAGDASNGDVNKTIDCVSYMCQGSLYIRPIAEVPKRRYEAAVAAYNRSLLVHQARQDGVALIMYAADYGDVLPSSQQNLMSILGPYLQDASLLAGFVYTFPGGSLDSLNNPAATQIGYVDAPDGRAVVYADGHSMWVPK
jgi:hypothetical protein